MKLTLNEAVLDVQITGIVFNGVPQFHRQYGYGYRYGYGYGGSGGGARCAVRAD